MNVTAEKVLNLTVELAQCEAAAKAYASHYRDEKKRIKAEIKALLEENSGKGVKTDCKEDQKEALALEVAPVEQLPQVEEYTPFYK